MFLVAFDKLSATLNQVPLVIVIPAIVCELTFRTFKLLFESISVLVPHTNKLFPVWVNLLLMLFVFVCLMNH